MIYGKDNYQLIAQGLGPDVQEIKLKHYLESRNLHPTLIAIHHRKDTNAKTGTATIHVSSLSKYNQLLDTKIPFKHRQISFVLAKPPKKK